MESIEDFTAEKANEITLAAKQKDIENHREEIINILIQIAQAADKGDSYLVIRGQWPSNAAITVLSSKGFKIECDSGVIPYHTESGKNSWQLYKFTNIYW